jgi:hypothetical protein
MIECPAAMAAPRRILADAAATQTLHDLGRRQLVIHHRAEGDAFLFEVPM